ncbi:MAG: glycosyl hydrolase, partial [Proteobacteria bacterium]|nr:glycosyl hydrolase [Pseudomonadota bacterium]
EHFGDEAALEALVDGAHDRGMRVLVDWVGNHVHEQHPYVTDHPDWFADTPLICDDDDNWNQNPETCWFDSFLPDVSYDHPDALYAMVDDAVDFALRWELDGFRVDAVKHMTHGAHASLQGLVEQRIEHSSAGGDEDFYTVGETFDGDRGLIASYINDQELDAQFDFPLYFTLRSTFLTGGSSLADLESSYQSSQDTFSGSVMSTFFGNHDVERSISVAWEGEHGECPSGSLYEASSPDWEDPYDQMAMAWTWLLTHEGLPLVYYGDEIGLPGHYDPDNRQVMRFPGELSGWEEELLGHVQALGQARLAHPQLAVGERTVWWEGDDAWAWTRVHEGEGMLAAVNLG